MIYANGPYDVPVTKAAEIVINHWTTKYASSWSRIFNPRISSEA